MGIGYLYCTHWVLGIKTTHGYWAFSSTHGYFEIEKKYPYPYPGVLFSLGYGYFGYFMHTSSPNV